MITEGLCFLSKESFVDQDESLFVADIEMSGNELKIKVFDETELGIFAFKDVSYPRDFFAGDDSNKHITFFDADYHGSSMKYRPSTVLKTARYAIESTSRNNACHLTRDTKIRKLLYFNPSLDVIFANNTVKGIGEYEEGTITVKTLPKRVIANRRISVRDLDVTAVVKLVAGSQWSRNKNNKYTIEPVNLVSISFSRAITVNEAHMLSGKVDSCLYMMNMQKSAFSRLRLYDYKGNGYDYFDLRNERPQIRRGLKFTEKPEEVFLKLFDYITGVEERELNGLAPFVRFQLASEYYDVGFTEYYRTLEYLLKIKLDDYTIKEILLAYFDEYPYVVDKYYGKKKKSDIEEMLRNLRNYFVHYGYFIKELPIPTNRINNPRKVLKISGEDIKCAYKFLRCLAFLKVYDNAGVAITAQSLCEQID